jgi:hypothetical protein
MPKGTVKEIISASAEDVFDLIHNYERRLEWDTLLQKAYLEPEFETAKIGAISVCQGRPILGGFALRTEYVSFQRGKVAAIKMLNQPPFFESFAASINHRNLTDNKSEVVYTFNFTAKPKSLQFILHPIMSKIFAWETGKRLQALKNYFEKS